MTNEQRRDQWDLVRSFTSYLRRKLDSFSICSLINHCSACGDVLSFTRGLTLAFGSDVSNKFGRKLYQAFLSNESKIVDCAFIVVMYKALVYAKVAYRNPQSIFLELVEEYTLNGDAKCEYKRVEDVLKIVSIAAVSSMEVTHTSGFLEDFLTNTCGEWISHLTMDKLRKAIDSCPSVMDHFRWQLVNQMPSDEKIELLCTLENESLGAFIQASQVIGVKRMHTFKMRRLMICFDDWKREVELSHRLTKRRKEKALFFWQKEARRLKMMKLLEEISLISFYKALIRRNFIKWRRLVMAKNRIQQICLSEDIDKEVRDASGHLRIFAKKLKRRLAFATWKSFTSVERRYEEAKHWHERKTARLAFHALYSYSASEIKQRKRIRDASIIQQKKLKQHQQQSMELERNVRKRPKWTSNLSSRTIQANSQQVSQKDIGILNSQREMRRKRVDDRKREMTMSLNSKWLAKQSEFETSMMRRIENWTATADYKRLFEDEEKKLKRILCDALDEGTERALTSNGVISYSILDGLMAKASMDPKFVFESLPDPFDIVAFEQALAGANCDADRLKRIFDMITGGSKSMSKQRLTELQQLSHRYNVEGSLWKVYVCSTSRRIQLHNISSGLIITTIKRKHIRQAVRENLRSCEMLKARRSFSDMKRNALRFVWEQHAAKIIQFMYHRWKSRQKLDRTIWLKTLKATRLRPTG